jgi:hypothetical protein
MQDRYPNLRNQLKDRSTFEKSITYTSAGDVWAVGALGAAGVAIVYNAISTVRTILGSSRLGFGDFFDVFMSTDGQSPIWVVLVYGPFVCIVVAVVALLAKHATLRSSIDKAYQEYLAGGFLADVWLTGAELAVGNNRHVYVILTPPGFADETAVAFGNWLTAAVLDPKNPTNKDINKSLSKVPLNPTGPVLATTIDASFPPNLWLVRSDINNAGLGIAGSTNGSTILGPKPVVVVVREPKKPIAYYISQDVTLS